MACGRGMLRRLALELRRALLEQRSGREARRELRCSGREARSGGLRVSLRALARSRLSRDCSALCLLAAPRETPRLCRGGCRLGVLLAHCSLCSGLRLALRVQRRQLPLQLADALLRRAQLCGVAAAEGREGPL